MGKRKYDSEKEEVKKKAKVEESDPGVDTVDREQPQNDGTDDEVLPSKGQRFNIKKFRKEISGKIGQTTALTQFLQVCLSPDSDADYMLDYLKAGGNSHEILRQISSDSKKNLSLATPTFHLFHLIILKVQSSLPHMITITEEACRYFLNTFMPTVEIMISENSGPRHRKIILRLLTSMVTLNPDLGVEVLNQAPLTPKHLQYILEKTNYKEKDNVRTSFVHFMTSFLVDGHLPLIKALLEKQGLLSLVIPGLIHDEGEAVLIFLNILKKNVIDNTFVSKSLKLKTFSHQVLHNMFKIYSWKGPPELLTDKDEMRPAIVELLSQIILTLFTSHKLGLYFTDTSLGTSDANKNQNLYKALLTLKRPWENEHEREVVLEIIHKCPDLHRAIISIVEQSFEPQHSPIWEKTTEFVIKLLNKLKPEDLIPKMSNLSPNQVANFIRFITLPVPLLKHIQLHIGKDETISCYCIKILVKMLETLRRYIRILELEESQTRVLELRNKLEYFFPKHLPVPGVIVGIIQDVINGKSQEEIKHGFKLPRPETTDSLISLVDLLLLYNDIHPTYFETVDSTLDMKKLLDYSKTLSTGPISVLKFKIVSLWLMLDSSAISLNNPMFKELFLIMLEVYTSDEDDTWIEAKEILIKFFKNTSIFEADEEEIHLMLYSLRNTTVNPPSIIADVVEYVLSNSKDITEFIRNQIVHFEISDEKSEASLDKLLNDLMANKKTEDSVFLENKTPSSFIVGCIQYTLNNSDKKKSLKEFLCLYVANLLHFNYSPELTEILLGDAKLDVRGYVGNWVSKPVTIPEAVIGKDDILNNLSKALIGNEDLDITEVFPFIKKSDGNEFDLCLNEEMYVIKVESNIDSSELLIWAKYLIFCLVRLTDLEHLEEDVKKKMSNYFECLIAIGKKYHMLNSCRAIITTLFKNPRFLKIYSPLEVNKSLSHTFATRFLLEIVEKHEGFVDYLNKTQKILKPFQQKNFNELVKAFIKINKKKNFNADHTVQVLNVIGLSDEDYKEVLNNVFNANLDSFVKDDKDPSLILDVLTVVIDKYSSSSDKNMTGETLKKVIKLYTDLVTNKEVTPNLTKLENALILFFENKPHDVKHITEEDFRKFFNANTVRKSTAQLASVLLMFNGKLCNVFKEEILRPEILSQRELTLPLGEAVLTHKQFVLDNKEFLNNIYVEYKTNIIKLLEKPHKAGQIYIACWRFIRKLIIECMDIQECIKLFTKTQKFETAELSHVKFFEAAFLKVLVSDKKVKKEHFVNYLMSLMNLTSLALKEEKGDEVIQSITVSIYTAVEIALAKGNLNLDKKDDIQKVTETAIWQNFCKSILKDSLRIKKADQNNLLGPQLLFVLTTLVSLFYPKDHEEIVTLFDMVTSHSEFLNVMLSHHSTDIKSRLIEFVILLISKNESVMKNQHIPVYLSAYRGTRGPCDKLILYLLYFYETHGVPVNEYKPYVWGDSAANHYAVRKNKTASLWAHPTPNQVINLFDRELIERTIRNFPVTERLQYNYELPPNVDSNNGDIRDGCIKTVLDKMNADGAFKSFDKDTEGLISNERLKAKYRSVLPKLKGLDLMGQSNVGLDDSIYDPAFVFPLLSHLLAPGSVASCFKLLRSGLLSLPVMALSSHCPMMRAAAYHVLHRFCMLLETETRHKNDKLLLSDFMETLRHSLSTAITNSENTEEFRNVKNPRLPAIDALYLARALMACTAPFDPLYKPVNNFLIAKQFVDLTVVPDFLNLFHDSDVESSDRRSWIIDIIKDGTKTMTDVNVVFKTMCLKMLMDFYSSVLCDRKGREKILGALASILAVPRAFDILNEGYGLMSWLQSVIRQLNNDKSCVKAVLNVIENVIYSMNVNSFARYVVGGKNQNVKTIDELQELRVSKDVEQEFTVMLLDVVKYVDVLELKDVTNLIRIFKLLSKKSIKCLPRRQMLSMVKYCSKILNCQNSVNLLTDALVSNDPLIIKSKCINVIDEKCIDKQQNELLLRELTGLVEIYVV